MKERVNLAGQHGDQNVGPPVVVVILKDGAHARERPAIGGERRARFQSAFGECAVAVIVEQKLAHAIVRNENIGEAVVIVVGKGHAERAPLDRRRCRNAG